MTNPNKNMLITLGVRDVVTSKDFYAGLGFSVKLDGSNMADFEMDGIRISLYKLEKRSEPRNARKTRKNHF